MRSIRLVGVLLLSLICLMLGHMLGILISLPGVISPEPDASRLIIPIQEEEEVFEPDYKTCIPKTLASRVVCERYE